MRVLCVHGHEGLLQEGETYTVIEQTERGNYILAEVEPPQPYVCFKSERFVPLRDLENIVELKEFEVEEQL